MAPIFERMGRPIRTPPIDTRLIDGPGRSDDPGRPGQRLWLRANGKLPDDPMLHACIVTYASDLNLLDTTLVPHRLTWSDKGVQMASLDHAMWFHRPFRADDWLLYDQTTPSTSAARGLAIGHLYNTAGELVVTVVQEGLLRGVV